MSDGESDDNVFYISSDDEDDEEIEEVLVYCHFNDHHPEPEALIAAASKLRIMGPASETPIVEFEPNVYKGTWKECIGSKILLEEEPSNENIDPVFGLSVPIKHNVKHTITKILELNRILPDPDELANAQIKTEPLDEEDKKEPQ